jgi:UDP-glucose 4-epimerase
MTEKDLPETQEQKPKRVLIMGICGGLAQITARLILQNHPDWEVIGIDSRNTRRVNPMKGLTLVTMRYSRGNFEKLFRENQFDIVYHLARLSHSTSTQHELAKRLELSVMGTNRILELCHRFNIKKVIILSTFHVYGALADNSIFIKEEAPLRASMHYAELRDVVEMDQICTNWMWKYQNQLSTVVLRPCNIIGNQIQNAMSKYLTSHWALRPMDYNPMFQFIHEFDMSNILYRSIDELPTGIYNVSTDDYISLREGLDIIGSKGIPFPISVADTVNKVLKVANLQVPEYLVDYLKFSCLISNHSLKKHLGDNFFRFSIEETLKLIKLR